MPCSVLQRRGCVRTSFEFARLLYGLDPATDPHGALLHLDYLAVKAGMQQWLLDIWDAQSKFKDDEWKGRVHVRALPGWAYSRALAMYIKEGSNVSVPAYSDMISLRQQYRIIRRAHRHSEKLSAPSQRLFPCLLIRRR